MVFHLAPKRWKMKDNHKHGGGGGGHRLDPLLDIPPWYIPDSAVVLSAESSSFFLNVGILKWCSRRTDVSLLPPAASAKISPYSTPCLFFAEVRIFWALTPPQHRWERFAAWSLISHETSGSDGWMIQCSLCIPHPLIGWRFTPPLLLSTQLTPLCFVLSLEGRIHLFFWNSQLGHDDCQSRVGPKKRKSL